MTTSEVGIALIKSHEGYSAFTYNDNGKPAIGYGHDLLAGESFPQGINVNQAVALLQKDLAERFEPPLNEYLKQHGITLTQNQFDAWVDFAYNLGAGSAITMISHGLDQVPAQMKRWNKKHVNGGAEVVEDPALTDRRAAEVALWTKTT